MNSNNIQSHQHIPDIHPDPNDVPRPGKKSGHYFPDYKNYYYLPMEDLVIHKSMKSFVDTTSIIRADKNNCYSKFTPGDSFLSAKTDVTNYCADIIYYILSEK